MDRAKQIWEFLGENDPYFAVSTYDEFRQGNLDKGTKERFFASGREYLDTLWVEIERMFCLSFSPVRSLDYGCGVGRVLIPLAGKSKSVVGVDISRAMLKEARKNCLDLGLGNVELQDADQFIERSSEKYDFVHSYIVLQHIAPKLGLKIIRKMVETLDQGGVGMVHVTFYDQSPGFQRFKARIYRDMPLVHRLLSAIRGKEARFMPMHAYDLNDVFHILNESGCNETFVRLSDHGFLGAMIFFRKFEA